MNLQTYFNNHYCKDFETTKVSVLDCLCDSGMSCLYSEGSYKKLHNLKLFVMFSYELNKFAQAIFTYFHEDYKEFTSKYPPVFLPGCMYFHNPNLYFSFHNYSIKYDPSNVFEPTQLEMEEVHNFVADLVREIIQDGNPKYLNYDLLNYCLKKDCDAWMPTRFFKQLQSFPKEEQVKLKELVNSMVG